jgi:purine-cytosine permease-like protein
VVWLVNHRWWTLTGAFAVLLLGLVLASLGLPRSVAGVIPGVVVLVLFLLFFASLGALMLRGGSRRPPGPN